MSYQPLIKNLWKKITQCRQLNATLFYYYVLHVILLDYLRPYKDLYVASHGINGSHNYYYYYNGLTPSTERSPFLPFIS